MRNIPVFYSIIGKDYSDCVTGADNTKGKALKKELDNLSDGESLARMLGIMCLLEVYAPASLSSQSAKKFPTSIIQDLI